MTGLPLLSQSLLHWAFPRTCALCAAHPMDQADLCQSCFDSLSPIEAPFCPRCGEAIDGAVTRARRCPNCHDRHKPYDFARAGFRSQSASRDLVHRFKYQKHFYLGRTLAYLAYQSFLADPRFNQRQDWLLVPVPLHASKRRKRSFNQATEIARQLSQLSQLPMREILVRQRKTSTQTKLSRRQRAQNLKDAFQLAPRRLPRTTPEAFLIIDDVFTTGSTVEACARVLKKAYPAACVAALTPLRA